MGDRQAPAAAAGRIAVPCTGLVQRSLRLPHGGAAVRAAFMQVTDFASLFLLARLVLKGRTGGTGSAARTTGERP